MKYALIETTLYVDETKRTSYGIAVIEEAKETPGIIDVAIDLCDDKARVSAFVDKCNAERIFPTKIYDEVEIFLH